MTENGIKWRMPTIQGWQSLIKVDKKLIKDARNNLKTVIKVDGALSDAAIGASQPIADVCVPFTPLYDDDGYCGVHAVMNAAMNLGVRLSDEVIKYAKWKFGRFVGLELIKEGVNHDCKLPFNLVKVTIPPKLTFLDVLRRQKEGSFVMDANGPYWSWIIFEGKAYVLDPTDGKCYDSADENLLGSRLRLMDGARNNDRAHFLR